MKRPHKRFEIQEWNKKQVLDKWDSHFKNQILKAFEKSKYTENVYDKSAEHVESNIEYSVNGMPNDVHVVAVKDGNVIGALFNVDPKRKYEHVRDTNYGWFYTNKGIPKKERLEIANAILNHTHDISRAAGYTFVSTQIGTKEGERFLARYHGYKRDPKNPGNWIKDLRHETPPQRLRN